MRGAVALGNEFVEVRVVVEKPVLLGDRGIRPIIRVRGLGGYTRKLRLAVSIDIVGIGSYWLVFPISHKTPRIFPDFFLTCGECRSRRHYA